MKQGEIGIHAAGGGAAQAGAAVAADSQREPQAEGAVLFWDEPETNLNPKLYGVVIDVLLELQRIGVQVFLATHDYVILKELDLQAKEGDKVAFHSLYRSEETGEIACQSTNSFLQIHPNAISEVFDSIYDRDVRRALEGIVK